MPFINLPAKKKYKRNYKNSKKRQERQEIYNNSKWHKLRAAYLMAHPLCEECEKEGRITPAQHVHHKISFLSTDDMNKRLALAYDYNNLESVCIDCHEKLHNNIKKKGRK